VYVHSGSEELMLMPFEGKVESLKSLNSRQDKEGYPCMRFSSSVAGRRGAKYMPSESSTETFTHYKQNRIEFNSINDEHGMRGYTCMSPRAQLQSMFGHRNEFGARLAAC
jgi:hypothetical protein